MVMKKVINEAQIGVVKRTVDRVYLNRLEAAAYMNVSVRSVDLYKHDGRLPFYMLGHKKILFRIDDLEKFMAQHRIEV